MQARAASVIVAAAAQESKAVLEADLVTNNANSLRFYISCISQALSDSDDEPESKRPRPDDCDDKF